MRLRLASPLLALVGVAPLSAAAAQSRPGSPSTADIAAVATPATVTILALGANDDTLALGSGFIVRESGVIVTNFHVLRGASGAAVLLPSKERFTRVSVLDADSALDLALLKIPGAGLPVLPTRTTTPRVGEKVITIGSPLGLSQTVSEGIVSATRMLGGHEVVQITAPISHGSSGGAVLDADGKVFAVSTSLLAEGQALNFAIPVRYALGLLGDNPRPRTVAEVFGAPAAMQAGRPFGGAGSPSAPDAATRRANPPRVSVSGVYRVVHKIHTSATDATQVGYLIATEHVGFLALANVLGKDSLSYSRIFDVSRWGTTSNGDVVLVAGATTWDGYQTADGGFIAGGRSATKSGLATYSLGGVPASLPLSRSDGVFAASVRTKYRTAEGVTAPQPFDWRGELVVAFAHDTMYASMYLSNDRGGFVYFRAHGPLEDREAFDLTSTNGARLRGFVRQGVLTASWEDVRAKGGTFFGTLNAERR